MGNRYGKANSSQNLSFFTVSGNLPCHWAIIKFLFLNIRYFVFLILEQFHSLLNRDKKFRHPQIELPLELLGESQKS